MNRPALNITAETRAAHDANRAAIGRSLSYERARMSAASLPSEDRLALAIWLVDQLDHTDPDARNEAVDVLGGLIS